MINQVKYKYKYHVNNSVIILLRSNFCERQSCFSGTLLISESFKRHTKAKKNAQTTTSRLITFLVEAFPAEFADEGFVPGVDPYMSV